MRPTLSAAGRVRTVVGAVVLAALFLSRPSVAVTAFPDVPPSDPAYTAVTGPHSPMSRAEFATIVTGAVCRNRDAPAKLPFRDVGSTAGAAPDLLRGTARAFAAGLMRGTTSTTFAADSPIRLAQALTVLLRAARGYVPGGLDPLPARYDGAFSDFHDPQHGENARLAASNGLIADPELARGSLDLSGACRGRGAGLGSCDRVRLMGGLAAGPAAAGGRPTLDRRTLGEPGRFRCCK